MTGPRNRILAALAGIAAVLFGSVAAVGADGRRGASLRVVEGEIAWIGEQAAEGGLPVVTVGLAGDDDTRTLLLAPRSAMDEVGVSVRVGDDIRARIFDPDDGGSCRVQKILNRTRGEMVRLRTLSFEPLWDGAGHWQGSSAGGHHGGEGYHHRGGSGDGQGRQNRGGR